uniref:EEF1A lysine methyltransferase 1 isoform X2 n=1 Tax=Elaeis guineensis var. tenera TaxID=51953 RepID=A0A8N4F307_ELAGV|nr:EEF1A lysine methyltransferase 1 isoform X2 [Elaeis guineensis]
MSAKGEERLSAAAKDGDDDDPPFLSSRALEALREFLSEQQGSAREEEEDGDGGSEEVRLLAEDWRLSQFWYDRETAATVAEEIRGLCAFTSSAVACVACPTIYVYLKKIDPTIPVQLLEYDKRFEQYGSDFTFYDYNQPEELPSTLKHAYKVVVADPPYLDDSFRKGSKALQFPYLVHAEQGVLGENSPDNFFPSPP